MCFILLYTKKISTNKTKAKVIQSTLTSVCITEDLKTLLELTYLEWEKSLMRTEFDKNPNTTTKPAQKQLYTSTRLCRASPPSTKQTRTFSCVSIIPEDSSRFANKEIKTMQFKGNLEMFFFVLILDSFFLDSTFNM